MKVDIKINGIVKFMSIGDYLTDHFSYLKMSTFEHPMTKKLAFFVRYERAGFVGECTLEPEDYRNGITINNKEYFGKALKSLFVELNNLQLEETLGVLK